ncbi:MAG: peptide chain release factor N(5)-glutamine methyltransferase [Chryseolinea sp.]
MKNSKVLYQELVSRVTLKQGKGEVSEMIYRVIEKAYGLSRTEILTGKEITVSQLAEAMIDSCIVRINRSEPIQYVLREADFYGRKYFVDESVLIPRPETEELIRLVVSEVNGHFAAPVTILDVGTGSGCIAITLALEIQNASLVATDVSESALILAALNQQHLGSTVTFLAHDILNEDISVGNLNLIVSNPPYIAMAEKKSMEVSVHQYEPGLALFVPDNDPLLFYNALAAKGMLSLLPSGILAVEINERFGTEVASSFMANGFDRVRIVKDIFAKDRMVIGYKNI